MSGLLLWWLLLCGGAALGLIGAWTERVILMLLGLFLVGVSAGVLLA